MFAGHVVSVRLDRLPWLFVLIDDSVWQAMPSTPPPPQVFYPAVNCPRRLAGNTSLLITTCGTAMFGWFVLGLLGQLPGRSGHAKIARRDSITTVTVLKEKKRDQPGHNNTNTLFAKLKITFCFWFIVIFVYLLFLSIWLYTINLLKENTTD